MNTLPPVVIRASYDVLYVHPDAVVIRDLAKENGTMSVTNDAEAVVARINAIYPNRRIFYYDTTGSRDELVHEDGRFIGFRPAPLSQGARK